MKKVVWMVPLVCLCCGLAVAGLAFQPMLGVRNWYGYSPDYGPGSGEPPEGGNCDNAGVVFPDNPFQGWPLAYRPGEWGLITFYFCNIYPDGSPHWGVDFAVPDGTPVVATAERAIVRQVETCDGATACWNYGMGRYVQVEAQARVDDYDQCVASHGGNPDADDCWQATGWLATYMHLQSASVTTGQVVRRGDTLAATDNSGNSTGSHLHYQINSPFAGAVDPAPTLGY
ncbi:MAG: M23 family metallopeptidase [Anaerolineales bacterium]|nr:M23 family metallopeptidase [Anaerolineales bacterium]